MDTLKKFASYYRPYRRVFYTDLFCALITSAVDITYPQILRSACSGLFTLSKEIILARLPLLAGLMLAMYIVQAGANYYVTYKGHMMGTYIERDMRAQLFDHYEKLSFSYFDSHNSGQIMSRVISDLHDISEVAHHGPENFFISLVKIAGSFFFLFMIEWRLSLILLLIVFIMAGFGYRANRRMRESFADNRRQVGNINETLQDSFSGVRIVQAFVNEDLENSRFAEGNEAFVDSKRVTYKVMTDFQVFTKFFIGLLYAATLVFGGIFIAHGHMSAGDLALFAIYIAVFVSPITVLIELTEMLQKGFSGFRRFREIVETEPEVHDRKDAQDLQDPRGYIECDDVCFRYGEDGEVLEHVSFRIRAGSSVALAGPSGGGKTTICSLLPRFYEPETGSIRIGGQDIADVTLRSLRQAIGIVQQDVYLFGGSIRENIEYGKPGAGFEEIQEAARKADIHDFIMSLPDGYDTVVGERGARLSGGQKQRISIARVFLKDPPILIFDEATSALDNESEAAVQQSLKKLAVGRTTITIAHRLSTIRRADEILVIDGRHVAERGSHDELIQKDGLYAAYCRMQFEAFED